MPLRLSRLECWHSHGNRGNDIAINAADIALIGSDLRQYPTHKAGRKVVRKLKSTSRHLVSSSHDSLGACRSNTAWWFSVIGDDGITLVIIAMPSAPKNSRS